MKIIITIFSVFKLENKRVLILYLFMNCPNLLLISLKSIIAGPIYNVKHFKLIRWAFSHNNAANSVINDYDKTNVKIKDSFNLESKVAYKT